MRDDYKQGFCIEASTYTAPSRVRRDSSARCRIGVRLLAEVTRTSREFESEGDE